MALNTVDKHMPGTSPLQGLTIGLGVCGSVAAYKALLLLRRLKEEGAVVKVLLTHSASRFVSAVSFAELSGNSVAEEMFVKDGSEPHIQLAASCDLLLVAPASAELMQKLAHGSASTLLSATLLSSDAPKLLAPAMHHKMWGNPATQRNIQWLRQDGIRFIGPVHGKLASGEEGMGRLAEVETIVQAVISLKAELSLAKALPPPNAATPSAERRTSPHLIISSGGTREAIDPVRFIGNHSSGAMGAALAEAAVERGYQVSLVHGQGALLPQTNGVALYPVTSAIEMQRCISELLGDELKGADALIMAAAVADYRPESVLQSKHKRSKAPLELRLIPNPDILAELGERREQLAQANGQTALPFLIGFALETGTDDAIIDFAKGKLSRKKVDLIIANRADEALGGSRNRAAFVSADELIPFPDMSESKAALAGRIIDQLSLRLS